MYLAAKCTSAAIRSFSNDPVFVDMCCGTGSMSKQALRMGFKTVITVDMNDSFSPDFCCDILDVHDGHPFFTKLDEFVKEGRVIVMHCSPPCDQFSRMNTTGDRDLIGAMKVVEKAVDIMCKYSQVWTLENPQTGLMWSQPYAKATFEHYHDFDYCAYGSITKKCTRFAFSSKEFKDLVVPRKCSSRETCPSCYLDPVTNRMRHTCMTVMTYEDRIAIPSQLCVVMMSAFRKMTPIVAEKFANTLMQHEMRTKTAETKKRPMYKEVDTESESDTESEWDEVETLLDRRGKGRGVEYLVKWKGCGDEENRWVAAKFITVAAKQDYKAACKHRRFCFAKEKKKEKKRAKMDKNDTVLAQLLEEMRKIRAQMRAGR